MPYFPDLSPHWYPDPEPRTVNVGWLDPAHDYPKGDTSSEFKEKLEEMCANAPLRFLSLDSHTCLFCGLVSGNGEIRVGSGQFVFASPVMIVHYVTDHGYRPPEQFTLAVMQQRVRPNPKHRPGGAVCRRSELPTADELARMRERQREFDRELSEHRKARFGDDAV